jgi:hypothetical protein
MPLVGAAPAKLTLVDGDTTIVIRDMPAKAPGDAVAAVACSQWDPGAPEPRTAMFERAGLDGVDDATAFVGARTVTLDLVVFGGGDMGYGNPKRSAYTLVEQLVSMTHPSRRPLLQVQRYLGGDPIDPVGEVWELKLRGNPFSIAYGRKAATMLELSLVFSAPEGLFEGPWQESYTAPAGVGEAKFVFPYTHAFTFGSIADSSPAIVVDVDSVVPVPPVLIFVGPATNPKVILSSGQSFGFTGLAIAAGQEVVVDMAAGTALLNGDWTSPVYHLVDWTYSTFWRLSEAVEATFSGGQAGGKLRIKWRNRRLTV